MSAGMIDESNGHGAGARERAKPKRRGTVLILVVAVLVLVAISAAVYVGVGRLELVAAAAERSTSVREDVAGKVIDYVGEVLVNDLYGNDPEKLKNLDANVKPFTDEALVPNVPGGGRLIIGERWDYPYTRNPQDDPNNGFGTLDDAWLASSEPIRNQRTGGFWVWPHLSNLDRFGRFVDLAKVVDRFDDLENGDSTFITRDPHELDTFRFASTGSQESLPFLYDRQLDEIDAESTGYVTFADQRFGTDTDGDGRIDARWTELRDVYGMPEGMRVFVAARIVDLSAALNVNANIETGWVRGQPDRAGTGRYPSDVDLYGLLWRGTRDQFGGGQLIREDTFGQVFGTHLRNTGMLWYAMKPNTPQYRSNLRLLRADRDRLYARFGSNPGRPAEEFAPYGIVDEVELRTFWSLSNDRSHSRLEEAFDALNGEANNPATWRSPLRNLWPHELDYVENTPDTDVLEYDVRRFLTTYNGAAPVAGWNLAGEEGHGLLLQPNLSELLPTVPDHLTTTGQPEFANLQPVFGGLMWALAPYAIEHEPGRGLFGQPPLWDGNGGQLALHYGSRGDGLTADAGFAYLRAAMLAVNARDFVDDDANIDGQDIEDAPTVRTLRFDRNAPVDPNRELYGVFEYGQIPSSLPSGAGVNQANTRMTLIGVERQPFFREVATLFVYSGDDDGDLLLEHSDLEYTVVAFELGNPWNENVSLGDYRIRWGDDEYDLPDGAVIPAGEYVVVLVTTNDENSSVVRDRWSDLLRSRSGEDDWNSVEITVESISFAADGSDPEDEIVTLWREDVPFWHQGTLAVADVLVDRIRAADSRPSDFPGRSRWDGPEEGFPIDPLGPSESVIVSASIRRYCGQNGEVGFPGYVFQAPHIISAAGTGARDAKFNPPIFDLDGYPDIENSSLEWADEINEGYFSSKGYGEGQRPLFDSFQWMVANVPLRTPVDLLNVIPVTHVHFAMQSETGFDPLTALEHHRYITISEMLGDENLMTTARRDLVDGGYLNDTEFNIISTIVRPTSASNGWFGMPDFRTRSVGTEVANPFVGRLDHTAFMPRDASGNTVLPPAVPLATRVVDAFRTVPVGEGAMLAQGRINLNTAAPTVLKALPWLHPTAEVYQDGAIILPRGDGQSLSPDDDLWLADAIRAYRDRDRIDAPGGADWFARSTTANLFATIGGSAGLRDEPTTRPVGLTSTGELALITRWDSTNGAYYEPAPNPSPDLLRQSLVRFGHDQPILGPTAGNLTFDPLDPLRYTVDVDDNLDESWRDDHDPADDPAEWLALLRAVNNSATVRSDVYCMYLKILGVSEADVADAKADADLLGGSELEYLRPSMEQRYLVIFDRSNVKSPSDRPRILYAQEVPSP